MKILGVDLKREWKAMALGAGVLFLLAVLPWTSGPAAQIIGGARDMVRGNK